MKRLILLLFSIVAYAQTCPTMHTRSDSVVACKLRVKNLSSGLLKSNSNGNISIATAGSDYLGYSGSTGQVSYFTSANAIGGSSNLFWNNTAKKLGIGTSSPEANLSIVGTSATNKMWSVRKYGKLYAHQIVDTGAAVYGIGLLGGTYLAIENTEASQDPQLRFINDSTNTIAKVMAYNSGTPSWKHRLMMSSSGDMFLTQTNNDNLYHQSTGIIGLGTSSPGATLPNGAVAGAKVLEMSSASGTRDVVMSLTGNSAAVSSDWWLDRDLGYTYLDNRYDSGAGKIGFRLRTTGTPVEAMSLWGTGDIGAGLTTTPAARLHLISTTSQQRIGYDASNYYSTTVASDGGVTHDAQGTGAGFTFADDLTGSTNINTPSTGTGYSLYNTADQTTNYERLRLYKSSNIYRIESQNGGTGTNRGLTLATTNRSVNIGVNSSAIGLINFNNTTAGTTTNLSTIGVNGTISNASATHNLVSILSTFNQSGTAGYRAFWISPFEQATGSATKYLIDAGTNSAADGGGTHTSKFTVDNSGNGRLAASLVLPSTSTSFDMYNTADETTNFERLRLNRTSNVFTLLSSAGGTGSIRDFQIGVNTTAIRSFLITTTASKAGQYRFSGTTSGVDNSALGVNTAFTSTSGTNQGVAIVPTINQSSTASYAALWIAPYEQTTGSGTKLLIDAGTSSAADGATYTSKFKVDNAGTTTIGGGLKLGYVEKTTTYAVLVTDHTINCTSGTFTVTLPTSVGATGQVYIIKNTGAGTITLATTSAQTIDGSTTQTILTNQTYKIQSTGANWIIL